MSGGSISGLPLRVSAVCPKLSTECVHMLELPLDGVKADGTYHHLKVNLDRTDVQITARTGYFLAKPEKATK